MHTNPADEERLALWLEDELPDLEQEAMDRIMAFQPEQLAAREEVRRWKQLMSTAIPASVEPPHVELFDARIARMIRETPQEDPAAIPSPQIVTGPAAWFQTRRWIMPLASCAGMALAFWLGTRQATEPTLSGTSIPVFPRSQANADLTAIDVTGAPRALPVDAAVYTPDNTVSVEWITGKSASVIVLNGMRPIPDETDFSQTAASGQLREIDLTAGIEP